MAITKTISTKMKAVPRQSSNESSAIEIKRLNDKSISCRFSAPRKTLDESWDKPRIERSKKGPRSGVFSIAFSSGNSFSLLFDMVNLCKLVKPRKMRVPNSSILHRFNDNSVKS
uniref:Uncharacterized protein n=1 Tax=Romanomermis culicivorax TaxID=13658 RepID=A0A915K4S3_ROMCU